jgi:hypothetical protein
MIVGRVQDVHSLQALRQRGVGVHDSLRHPMVWRAPAPASPVPSLYHAQTKDPARMVWGLACTDGEDRPLLVALKAIKWFDCAVAINSTLSSL